jgi:peroxiredoxin (alkyl hydroperoxide reductase subunit C)
MSLIGTEIKPFRAQAFQKGEFLTITDKNFKGKWSIVAFYPADFSFVCPTELEDLQENYAALKNLGAEIYSVSTDTHYVHKAWHDTSDAIKKVEYIMIGDPSHAISKNFDILNEADGLADRGTFIIDPDGIIQSIEINSKSIGRNAAVLFNKIKAAQYVRNHPGEVCPAKWQEGGETLKPSLDLVGKI